MARIDYGNAMENAILQPGWKVQGDGYGLMTGTCVFKSDQDGNFNVAVIGSSHPNSGYSYMKAHKVGVTYDALNIATITVEYVGIDSSYTGSNYTLPQMVASNSLGSENITTHINFLDQAAGWEGPIAGRGTAAPGDTPVYPESDLGPTVKGPTGEPVKSRLGSNGACFEKVAGGRFIGFVDPEVRELYGKTNYLTPTTTFSGFFYTTDTSAPGEFVDLLGASSNNGTWGGVFSVSIIPSYVGAGGDGEFGPKLLLSNANVERYAGSVLKISYEVRYTNEGWSRKVYYAATT
jgi:hypothetical protein